MQNEESVDFKILTDDVEGWIDKIVKGEIETLFVLKENKPVVAIISAETYQILLEIVDRLKSEIEKVHSKPKQEQR
jgi:PHD/YefM family antitoxin component YafN of YafNO toxin-antitoxin module